MKTIEQIAAATATRLLTEGGGKYRRAERLALIFEGEKHPNPGWGDAGLQREITTAIHEAAASQVDRETARRIFDAGFAACRAYNDNHHHYRGSLGLELRFEFLALRNSLRTAARIGTLNRLHAFWNVAAAFPFRFGNGGYR